MGDLGEEESRWPNGWFNGGRPGMGGMPGRIIMGGIPIGGMPGRIIIGGMPLVGWILLEVARFGPFFKLVCYDHSDKKF